MTAEFNLIKYTGKDCAFGQICSSLGIKRVDTCVPAVYGVPIVPADDKTDAATYSVYRPDTEDGIAYSFETVFKMVLKTPPSNQLSHVRIYPAISKPDPKTPDFFIGCTSSYSRPTNNKSLVATSNLWSYSKESPFLVTVNGNFGQYVDEQVSVLNYNITQNDIGFGNVMYLNGERQIVVPFVEGNVYTFVDKTDGAMEFGLFDINTNDPVVHPDVVVSINGDGERVVTITTSNSLLSTYPDGFVYSDINDITVGNIAVWLDFSVDPIETVEYTVTVQTLPNGSKAYFLNGIRNPVLNFRENRIYKFINLSGDTDPIRFLRTNDLAANNESSIIINGIEVENGGTVDEIVTVYPSKVKVCGDRIVSYQSVFNSCYGNKVNNINTALVGNYNINTVGGGVFNPMAAGETDFIYLQLEVKGDSTVGDVVPELVIEYDEN